MFKNYIKLFSLLERFESKCYEIVYTIVIFKYVIIIAAVQTTAILRSRAEETC